MIFFFKKVSKNKQIVILTPPKLSKSLLLAACLTSCGVAGLGLSRESKSFIEWLFWWCWSATLVAAGLNF